jgi:hypothetical protein
MSTDRIKTYQELHEKYMHELEKTDGEYHLPNSKNLLDFDAWVESQSGGNKAYVLLDVLNGGQYTEWHLIKELFGYDNHQFTGAAVNNLAELMLVHPDHIEHKRRYSDIIMGLVLC